MTELYLKDNIEIDAIKKNVNLCRTGEYQYLAKELGLNDRQPNDIIKVLRDEQSIKYIVDKINEYGAIPILINHPDKFVDLKDTMSYKRGGVGKSKIKKIGDSQVATAKIVAISDDTKELMDKGQEVSMGYTAELIKSNNPLYDYTLNIKDVNHLAIVPLGRAGSLCSIQDKGIDYKKLITDKLAEDEDKEIKDGGAGSGNWGHDGRPGEVGGSQPTSIGRLTTYQNERISYGRKTRDLAVVFGADNIGKKYKEKIQKELEASQKASREQEVSGKIITKYYGSSSNYQKGDQKRTVKMQFREAEKAKDPNYKPEFKTIITTPRGAKLIEKDEKVAWVSSRMIREDGTLTKGGIEALAKGKDIKQYEAEQNLNKKVVELKIQKAEENKKEILEKTGYDVEKDESDKPFIAMKKRLSAQNPEVFEKIKNEVFKIPRSIQNILETDNTAFLTANYWQSPDQSKKRIYYDVSNAKGFKYPLTKNYEEI